MPWLLVDLALVVLALALLALSALRVWRTATRAARGAGSVRGRLDTLAAETAALSARLGPIAVPARPGER
ncbi:MAG TPA: hypothetical protein VKP11_06180 [Frankiaceae bacterium]|nr:hypothetical protein [Frankiaceae bacterium]